MPGGSPRGCPASLRDGASPRRHIPARRRSSQAVSRRWRDIGRAGCRKPGSSMPWPGSLRPAARPASASAERRRRSAPARSGRAQVGLLAGEQAVAQLAVGGEPDPVAGAAERPGDRADDADPRRAAVDHPLLGRRAAPRARPPRASARTRPQAAEDLVGGHHRRAVPAVLGVQRHLLDEPQLVARVEAPAQQRRRPRRR